MKKRNIIIFSIILVITAIVSFNLGAMWYYDNSRIIEEVSGYVKEGDASSFAVSLKETDNSIVLTIYSKYTYPIKHIRTYNITNNVVSSIMDEFHCSNKFEAKEYAKNYGISNPDVKVKDNIVTGYVVSSEIGKSKDEMFEQLKKFKEIYKVVEE